MESQRLCCRIFYSLSFLPRDTISGVNDHKWMSEFKNYLTVKYSALEDDGGADGVELVDGLRVAVCDVLSQFMLYHSFFKKYLDSALEAVCGLFVAVSASPTRTGHTNLYICKVFSHCKHELIPHIPPFLLKRLYFGEDLTEYFSTECNTTERHVIPEYYHLEFIWLLKGIGNNMVSRKISS